MKSIILTVATLMLSCSRYIPLSSENIVSIRPVFKNNSSYYSNSYSAGYLVGLDSVMYDKWNINVKKYLSKNLNQVDLYEKEPNPDRVIKLFANRKTSKYLSIKVTPLREFGYIQSGSGEVVLYGITKDHTFIDLSSNRNYLFDMN